jgi:amino acid transporter
MNNLTPVLGIFMSIPSILFVVDGFYSATAIQSSMREPKKMSKAILFGLVAIVAVDILIALSLMFGPKAGGGIGIFAD